ncbi:MAG TPA: hypothetical protein VGF84_14850, partial [Micromonosporaceae bacterium]
ELANVSATAEVASSALAQERSAHMRTSWERDAAQKDAGSARETIEALRAENLARVTEAAELRGALSAAKADLLDARSPEIRPVTESEPEVSVPRQPEPPTP